VLLAAEVCLLILHACCVVLRRADGARRPGMDMHNIMASDEEAPPLLSDIRGGGSSDNAATMDPLRSGGLAGGSWPSGSGASLQQHSAERVRLSSAQLLRRTLPLEVPLAGVSSGGERSMEDEMLRNGYTRAEVMREVSQQNMRLAINSTITTGLASASCAMIFTLMVGCVIGPCVIFFLYIYAWFVWLTHSKEACDQPLDDWLGAYLMYTMLMTSCKRVILHTLCWWTPELDGEQLMTSPPLRVKLLNLLIPVLPLGWMVLARVLLSKSKTCRTSNPELFVFVDWYSWVVMVLYSLWCGISVAGISLLLWAARNGYLGQVEAASPDTIDKIETVKFDLELFANPSDPNDSRPVGECCICLEAYNDSKPIKRTRCGHFMHRECLEPWLLAARSCPACRNDLEVAHGTGGREMAQQNEDNQRRLYSPRE